jgi:hypothetical protein
MRGTPTSAAPFERSIIEAAPHYFRAVFFQRRDAFARRAAGRDNVFDDQNFFVFLTEKPRRTVIVPVFAFRPDEADD